MQRECRVITALRLKINAEALALSVSGLALLTLAETWLIVAKTVPKRRKHGGVVSNFLTTAYDLPDLCSPEAN